MKLTETFDLSALPFQGDRTAVCRRIPVGARIQNVRATVQPKAPAGNDPFTLTIDFGTGGNRWGATKIETPQAVEVDFHGRRKLVEVSGNLSGATLQVDLGGAYVDLNDRGALKTPSDDKFFSLSATNPNPLPGVSVTKFRLTGNAPTVSTVKIQSLPTNVSLRLGEQPIFWMHIGELAQAETTPDFTAALQTFLNEVKVENGFYVVPLVVHSDSLARLEITLTVDYLIEQSALPAGLSEVTLPYEFDGLPQAEAGLLTLTLPAHARLVPQACRARVTGAFADTRVAYDPTESIAPDGLATLVKPAGQVAISDEDAFAQPIRLAADATATAIDLLLNVRQSAKLRLDLREDLDGKPGELSLLPKPVDFELTGVVGKEAASAARWVSVPLPVEFQFIRARRYWLVLQSLTGTADWSVAPAAATTLSEPGGLQRLSQRAADAALAWREAAVNGVAPLLAAFFRLRYQTKRFTMPIALQVGDGEHPVRVSLDRYADQGRVDFPLNFAELETARQKFLTQRPTSCSTAELLENGMFEKWFELKNKQGEKIADRPRHWDLTAGQVFQHPQLNAANLSGSNLDESPSLAALSQVVPVQGSCLYDFSFVARPFQEAAVAEIFWLNGECGLLQTDAVPIEPAILSNTAAITNSVANDFFQIRLKAPAQAQQAEVRFGVQAEASLTLQNVSLRGATNALLNSDFKFSETVPDNENERNQILHWKQVPYLDLTEPKNPFKLENKDTQDTAEVMQVVAAKSDQPFVLALAVGAKPTKPFRLEAHWRKADGSPVGAPSVITLDDTASTTATAQGRSPKGAEQAEIRLVLPASSGKIEIQNVGLHFPAMTSVPITFVAQAPGQLTLTDLQLAFEEMEPVRPALPAGGLCKPTPPGGQPGTGQSECGTCSCCGGDKVSVDPVVALTDAGRPVTQAICANCGIAHISFSGAPATNAPRFRFPSAPPPSAPITKPDIKATTVTPLDALMGIAQKRSALFQAAGIDSVEALAALAPDAPPAVQGFSPKEVALFIQAARLLLNGVA